MSLVAQSLALTYYHFVDAAVGQDGEGPLVQVHDGVVGPLVPGVGARGLLGHLLTTGSVCRPTIR